MAFGETTWKPEEWQAIVEDPSLLGDSKVLGAAVVSLHHVEGGGLRPRFHEENPPRVYARRNLPGLNEVEALCIMALKLFRNISEGTEGFDSVTISVGGEPFDLVLPATEDTLCGRRGDTGCCVHKVDAFDASADQTFLVFGTYDASTVALEDIKALVKAAGSYIKNYYPIF
jgi:hypothetical protein